MSSGPTCSWRTRDRERRARWSLVCALAGVTAATGEQASTWSIVGTGGAKCATVT